MMAKGRSITAVIVAVVKKERTASKSLRLLAKEPTEAGCSLIFKSNTFSKMILDIMISLFFPANSSMYPRVSFKKKSSRYTKTIPIVKTISVSCALFGITRSYTFIVKSGVASTKRFISKDAHSTSLYIGKESFKVLQNQCFCLSCSVREFFLSYSNSFFMRNAKPRYSFSRASTLSHCSTPSPSA